MTRKSLILAAVSAAAALVVGPPAAAVAPSAASAFDTAIAAAKSAMMADPARALARSGEALALARSRGGDPQQQVKVATAQWLQGEALLRLNRLAEAGPIIDKALATAAERAPNSKLHGDLTMAQGGALAVEGHVQPAMADFQAAYRIFGAAGQPRGQAMALQNIGSIYQDAGDYPKVMQYYAQSAEAYRADPALLVTAHNNVGDALKAQKQYPQAEAEFEKALAVARQMQSPSLQASILTNLASAEILAGQLGPADRHVAEALRLSRGEPAARDWQAGAWGVAAQAAARRGQYAAAAQLLERTFRGADLETTSLLFRDFHQTAYEVYSRLGDDHRALAHLRAFKRLDDEARELRASTNAALMAARFDFAAQASRIAQLKTGQLQRDVALARSRNTVTLVLLVGSVLVALLLLVSFLTIRRRRNEVRAANAQLSRVNRELEKALNARTEFLATTSHEIRTPLNGMLGMTQVILAQPSLDPELRDRIALVQGSGETMRALIDDILDVAKIETGKLVISRTEVDLPRLLDETARLWSDRAQTKGLMLSLDVALAPAGIVEDAGRLRQILFNLMSNAIKFTETGTVTLTARVETEGDGETLVFQVADTGIGIPANRTEEVFESFSQVDSSVTRVYGGTGLGLSICRSLAHAMDGEIGLESRLGEGSVFTLRLPLVRAAPRVPAGERAGEAPAERFAACALLLVEANPLAQSLLRAVLQPKVGALSLAASIGEALTAAACGGFDLALVEAGVLDGGEGRAANLARLADAMGPAPVCVTVTAPGEADAALLLAHGARRVIAKPIAAEALVTALREEFDRRADPADRAATAARAG